MRIKKFQNPAGPLLRNYVVQNDVTYVPQSRIIQKYELPGYITLTDGTKIKPNNTVTKVSPQSNTLPQQQAYYNAIGKEKDKKEKQRQQIEEAGRITLGALDAIATLPSRTIGAVKDAKSENKSFVSSMIEGNEGLGNEELNTLANFIGPAAFTKGLQIFPKGIKVTSKLIPEYSIRMVNAPWAGSLQMGGMPSKIPSLQKIIYKTTRPGLPYYESDLEALKVLKPTEHNVNGQIRRVYKLDGKQPMTEQEYDNLMGKYFKVNTLPDKELDKIVKQFEQDKIFGFSVPEWKAFRKGFSTTDRDITEYKSYLPEYYKLYQELVNKKDLVRIDGKWFGKINGQLQQVNPRQYIRSQSKNFQNNGWKFNGLNRGTAMKPKTAETLQNNGGLGAPNWTTTSDKQLSRFSQERDNGPILKGIVGKSDKPAQILPYVQAKQEENDFLKGITDFDAPVEYKDYGAGTWRIYGPDQPITSIDANTGRFKNVLNSLTPLAITGSLARFLHNQNNK